jgi:hypothetical protein
MMHQEPCTVCGGEGRIGAGARGTATCPACRGSGNRPDAVGFYDVTKTKPSHHHPAASMKDGKRIAPVTASGRMLVEDVKKSNLPDKDKARLTQSIIDYEERKGECTKTFSRLVRKELRNAGN